MAHVATWKKDLVSELVQDMREAPVVAVVDMENIPGQQIQAMRAGLRAHAKLKMTKNKLMLLALDEVSSAKPGIEALKDSIDGQCAIVTTDMDPFKLFAQLKKTMSPAPAKPGQIAPFDIVVPKGPTPFGPGPIIGELQKIGLPAAIEGGKIGIKKDTTLVKEGEPIPADVAAMLPKLEILPMIVGLDLRAAYEDGTVYHKDVLDIPEDYYANMFATAAHNALALGVEIAFPTKETTPLLIAKAFRETVAVSVEAAIPNEASIKTLVAKADAQALSVAAASGYQSDSVNAKVAAAAVAAPAAAAAAPAAESVKEDEPEEVSEEDAAAGLSALFG
ncbi:MAG: 50S ribosomal protein L10 [Thermoplasmata archaeon]|nr:50S ribosomal protein L10 [Thermoplasmata archaeon]WII08148.1 50S ribosomal protein L10 [Methanomassiliicoccales archaeon LGM-RCC1]